MNFLHLLYIFFKIILFFIFFCIFLGRHSLMARPQETISVFGRIQKEYLEFSIVINSTKDGKGFWKIVENYCWKRWNQQRNHQKQIFRNSLSLIANLKLFSTNFLKPFKRICHLLSPSLFQSLLNIFSVINFDRYSNCKLGGKIFWIHVKL